MNKERNNFIINIKNLLKEKKLNRKQFADLIGCSKTAVSKWLLNQTQPTFDNIVMIIKVLNCTFEDLIS